MRNQNGREYGKRLYLKRQERNDNLLVAIRQEGAHNRPASANQCNDGKEQHTLEAVQAAIIYLDENESPKSRNQTKWTLTTYNENM